MAPDTSGSLERLDVLVGEWETNVPGVEAEGRTTFEWLEGGGFLIERSTVDRPEFPNGICVIGATGPDGGLQQHYFDSRGVARVYEMTLEDGVWTLFREGPDWPQRYSMGGIVVSLVETLVFGRRAGEAAARSSLQRESQLRSKPVTDEAHADLDSLIHNGTELSRALQRAVRNVMWEHCGVVREASDLEQALGMLDEVRSALPSVDVRPSEEGWGDLAHVLDVQAMLGTAEATLRGAIAREETRGAHNRSDFPELDPAMGVNFIVGRDSDARMTLEPVPVRAVSMELASWLARAGNIDPAGQLLE